MTEQAASMIRDLIDQADLPQTAGLRIAQRDDHTALAMTLAQEPGQDDLVLAEHNVAVCSSDPWQPAESRRRPSTPSPERPAPPSTCGSDQDEPVSS